MGFKQVVIYTEGLNVDKSYFFVFLIICSKLLSEKELSGTVFPVLA